MRLAFHGLRRGNFCEFTLSLVDFSEQYIPHGIDAKLTTPITCVELSFCTTNGPPESPLHIPAIINNTLTPFVANLVDYFNNTPSPAFVNVQICPISTSEPRSSRQSLLLIEFKVMTCRFCGNPSPY